MSKEEKKTSYHLLFDEDTGELTPKTEKVYFLYPSPL